MCYNNNFNYNILRQAVLIRATSMAHPEYSLHPGMSYCTWLLADATGQTSLAGPLWCETAGRAPCGLLSAACTRCRIRTQQLRRAARVVVEQACTGECTPRRVAGPPRRRRAARTARRRARRCTAVQSAASRTRAVTRAA